MGGTVATGTARSRRGRAAVAVIIPVRDRGALLDRTLGSLAGQTGDVAFRTLVVDDGSTEDLAGVCTRHATRLRVEYLRRSAPAPAPGAARDMGARYAAEEMLVFLDAGIVVPPGFVAAHRVAHRAADRIGIGYYHGHQLHATADAAWQRACTGPGGVLTAWETEPTLRDPRCGLPPFEHLAHPWVYGWGGNLSCRNADYVRVGGFSLEHGFGFEDLDLSWRLHRAGCVPTVVPDGWGVHLPHPRAPLAERKALDLAGWSRSYRRDRAVELEAARLGIDVVGTGPDALLRLDSAVRAVSRLLTGGPIAHPLPPAPAGLPRPAFVVAGHPADARTYDAVGVATTGFPSTGAVWGCCGALLPAADRELGCVVVRSRWLHHMVASPPLGPVLLEQLAREAARAARTVVIHRDQPSPTGASGRFVELCGNTVNVVWLEQLLEGSNYDHDLQ